MSVQHIKMDHFDQNFKTDFLLFPKWLFYQLNFGGKKCLKLDIAFARYDIYIEDIITDV